ncbi:unnamed protein product [Calypogeia fissa]
MSLEKLKPPFADLRRPIRLVQEYLLGKSRPTCLNSKQMWVYWSYWWPHVNGWDWEKKDGVEVEWPELKPDWARLVLEDLSSKIEALRKHLTKVTPPTKRYAANCGMAITKFLIHHGYSLAELQNADPGAEAQEEGNQEERNQKEPNQEEPNQEERPHQECTQQHILLQMAKRLLANSQNRVAKLQSENQILTRELVSAREEVLEYQTDNQALSLALAEAREELKESV